MNSARLRWTVAAGSASFRRRSPAPAAVAVGAGHAELLPEARFGELYFAKDSHGTPAAQPLVADAVAKWLARDEELGLAVSGGR